MGRYSQNHDESSTSDQLLNTIIQIPHGSGGLEYAEPKKRRFNFYIALQELSSQIRGIYSIPALVEAR